MNRKVPVENVEHLTFHPTNVPMLENPGTPRPNDVLHHLIVEVLQHMDEINEMSSSLTSPAKKKTAESETHFASEHESSNEDPLTSPTFGGYPQVGLRSLNIDQSDEHDCDADSGRANHPPHKLGESTVFLFAVARCAIKR